MLLCLPNPAQQRFIYNTNTCTPNIPSKIDYIPDINYLTRIWKELEKLVEHYIIHKRLIIHERLIYLVNLIRRWDRSMRWGNTRRDSRHSYYSLLYIKLRLVISSPPRILILARIMFSSPPSTSTPARIMGVRETLKVDYNSNICGWGCVSWWGIFRWPT